MTSLDQYTAHDFLTDAMAGVIVGIVALPLAIAFGIASGVTPAQGLYTAIIGGFLVSALSGSRVQIGGPTGAFVVIVYGVIQQYGYDGLAVATLMAGVLLVAMGIARMGAAIKFIPYPVTLGFTAGIALIIGGQQVKDVLGLRMGAVPPHFFEQMAAYGANLASANWQAIGLSAATVALIVLWPRAWSRLPSPFVALVACTAAAHLLRL
ncbi:MAG TPA: SulP family inorganic anion transporter, partial [Gemmatimonadaceae bacterium]|nr:SulP family inorganic anion transporter [Gemmatimonadaceae bacterium]